MRGRNACVLRTLSKRTNAVAKSKKSRVYIYPQATPRLSFVSSNQKTGGADCTFDDSTGLPDSDCWFYPYDDNDAVTSLMSFTYLDNVSDPYNFPALIADYKT